MATDRHWHDFANLGKQEGTKNNDQQSLCIWLTGLSASGKSSIACSLHNQLFAKGLRSYVLDGDIIRHGLNRDLGFSSTDRSENIRRVAEVARLMVDAGLITIVSFISPFRMDRRYARALFEAGAFYEVFIDTPFSECERRDPKGLYQRARHGEINDFTAIDSVYEVPEAPDIKISTVGFTQENCAGKILTTIGI